MTRRSQLLTTTVPLLRRCVWVNQESWKDKSNTKSIFYEIKRKRSLSAAILSKVYVTIALLSLFETPIR